MKIQEFVENLSLEEVENLGEVLLTFMHDFRPGGQELDWLLDFYTRYNTELIFKWTGLIDQIIGVPFPSALYRDRAHLFGDLIQKRFDQENLGITLIHPLFMFVGLFAQILEQSTLIYFVYRDDPEKVEAILRLDYFLKNKIMIDYSAKTFVLIPGYGDLYDLLQHIIEMDVIDIEKISIFQAKLEFPLTQYKLHTEIYLYRNLASKFYENSDTIRFHYI